MMCINFRIPYYFSTSKELPGKFMLSYMPRDRSVHEFVTVTHEGLRFRGQVFPTLNMLIRWFKEHFKDPIPQKLVTPSSSTATPSEWLLWSLFLLALSTNFQSKSDLMDDSFRIRMYCFKNCFPFYVVCKVCIISKNFVFICRKATW